MGLDGVMMVMEIEDRFGISIRLDEGMQTRTVGDLIDLALLRFAASRSGACHTQRAFYQVRRDLRSLLEDPTLRPRPSDRITDIVPRARRRMFWKVLAKRIGREPPPLRLPQNVSYTATAITLRLLCLGTATALWHGGWFPWAPIGCVLLVISFWWALRPLAIAPPPELSTVADVARRVAGTKVALHDSDPRDPETWVPGAVCDIVAEALGVDRQLVVREARLVEDLGMN